MNEHGNSAEDQEYVAKNMPRHLLAAGRIREFEKLMSDPEFIELSASYGVDWSADPEVHRALNIRHAVFTAAGGIDVRDKSYHTPLPPELALWYVYPQDSGHSIVCILKGMYQFAGINVLVPASVKSVLRGYEVDEEGFVIVDLPYSEEYGLITPEEDCEF